MKKEKILNLVKNAGVILPAIYYGNAKSLIVNATDADIDWIADSANAANSSFMNLADTVKKEGAGVYQLFLIIGIVGVMCFGVDRQIICTYFCQIILIRFYHIPLVHAF